MCVMPTQRPNPCREGNVHLKREEKSEGHRGIVDKLKPRVTPPQPRRARRWRVLQAERGTRAFERFLTSRPV